MAIMRPRPDRRRRILAAPLVMTASLAPACVVKSGQPTTPTTAPTTTTATGDTGAGGTEPTGGVIANPPRPTTDLPAAPIGPGKWEQLGGEWTYRYDDGNSLTKAADGTCTIYYGDGDCPPTATCNPPPPQEVQCPADAPSAAPTRPVRPTGPTEAAPTGTAPTTGANPEPRVIANPPRPTATKPTWEKIGDRWTFVEADQDRIVYYPESDSCTRYVHVTCKPNATCNPPPPQKAPCPDGLPADARRK